MKLGCAEGLPINAFVLQDMMYVALCNIIFKKTAANAPGMMKLFNLR